MGKTLPSPRCVLLLGVALWSSTAVAGAAAGQDAWLGPDKALHFGASAALPAAGYLLGAAFSEEPGPRLAVAAGLSLSVGVGKELWDLSGRGDPSLRDLGWDVAGVAVGTALVWGFDRLLVEPPRRRWRAEKLRAEQARTVAWSEQTLRLWLSVRPPEIGPK